MKLFMYTLTFAGGDQEKGICFADNFKECAEKIEYSYFETDFIRVSIDPIEDQDDGCISFYKLFDILEKSEEIL